LRYFSPKAKHEPFPGSVDAALKEIFSGSPLLAIHHQLQVANVTLGRGLATLVVIVPLNF
jgi:hypothetical protein